MTPRLQLVHSQTLKQVVRDEATIRRIHADSIRAVRDGRLTVQQASAWADAQMNRVLERGIKQAIRRQYRYLNSVRADMGFARMSRAAVERAITDALPTYMDTAFPGTSYSTRDRIRALSFRLQQGLSDLDRLTGSERREAASRLIAQHGKESGSTGASNPLQVRRIARTEYLRSQRDASAAVYRDMGVGFVYWRLSAAHVWKGGREICEQMAAAVSSDSRVPPGTDPAGLYAIDEVPGSPHPHCMCYLEPAFPPGFGGTYGDQLREGNGAFSVVGSPAEAEAIENAPATSTGPVAAAIMAEIGKRDPAFVEAQRLRGSPEYAEILDDPLYRSYTELVSALGPDTAFETLESMSEELNVDLLWVPGSTMAWVPLVALLEDDRAVG